MEGFPQVRVARPTSRLREVARFYEEDLGWPRVAAFEGHAGYSGVVLAIPGTRAHVEFTQHEDGSPCPAPTRDNLLVVYAGDDAAYDALVARMRARGHPPVPPENPWWATRGETYEDPDGWRVVVARGPGLQR